MTTPAPTSKAEISHSGKDTGRAAALARWVKWNYKLLSAGKRFALASTSAYSLGRALQNRENLPRELSLMMLDLKPETGTAGDIAGIFSGLVKNWVRPRRRGFIKSLPALHFPACKKLLEETKGLEKTLLTLAERMEGEWRPLFNHRGISLARQAAGKLRVGILPHLLKLSRDSARLYTALQTVRPALVISPFSVGHTAVLGDLCRRMNIPSILVPHGSLLPPKNQWEEIEWRRLSHAQMLSPYSYTAAQTPMAAGHADYYRICPPAWKTGPILFAQTDREKGMGLRRKLKISGDARVIVYATAQRKRSSFRFYIFETEDEYLSSLSDIVRAVDGMENTRLIIKLHPSCSIPDDRMRRILPVSGRISFLRETPFSEVLAAGDLLISYISTTIEEALLNRVPVVLYDKWRRFSFFEALNCGVIPQSRWTASAGYYTGNPETLGAVIEFALNQASRAAEDDALYSRFRFPEDQRESLGGRIENMILRPAQEIGPAGP